MPLDLQWRCQMTGPDTLIVFTDLDGTLLDHETYDYAAARPALDRLRRERIPLILSSSKTAAEIAPLRHELGFDHCEAIVENGAGILEAGKERPAKSATRGRLMDALDSLPPDLRGAFRCFSDCSVGEIADMTGLEPDAAARARQRDFSEPGLWTGTAEGRARFLSELSKAGIMARQGGRFLTLSFGGDKADGLRRITDRYAQRTGARPISVALGDAPNDAVMLEAADIGYIVANPAHGGIPRLAGEDGGKIRRIDAPGPVGWNQAVLYCIGHMKKRSANG
jgi:mannosyl-3-phosphoglycerate phosphatase